MRLFARPGSTALIASVQVNIGGCRMGTTSTWSDGTPVDWVRFCTIFFIRLYGEVANNIGLKQKRNGCKVMGRIGVRQRRLAWV